MRRHKFNFSDLLQLTGILSVIIGGVSAIAGHPALGYAYVCIGALIFFLPYYYVGHKTTYIDKLYRTFNTSRQLGKSMVDAIKDVWRQIRVL